MADHQALFQRVVEIHNAQAWDRLGEVYTEDCVEEYPQSGERFVGLANVRATRARYPAPLPRDAIDAAGARLAASEERWVITPMFTALKVEGSGHVGTAVFRTLYPDGSAWWIVNLWELRGGRIARNRAYFAPEFDPPEWRAPFREPAGGT